MSDTLTIYSPPKFLSERGEHIGASDGNNTLGFYLPSSMSAPTMFIDCGSERFTKFSGDLYEHILPEIKTITALGATLPELSPEQNTGTAFDLSPTPLATICNKLHEPKVEASLGL